MLTSFLVGGKEYEFILIGWIAGGNPGMAKRKIIMNESPKNGKCTVKPAEGVPLEPKFTLNCSGFIDTETPLQYEFFYSKGKGYKNETLGSGPEASRVRVTFPSGLEKNEYKLTLYAKISDSVGASRMVEFESPIKVSSLMEAGEAFTHNSNGEARFPDRNQSNVLLGI